MEGHHSLKSEILSVADSKTAFLQAWLILVRGVWHRGRPKSGRCCCSQTQPHRPWECPSETELLLSHEHRGLPRGARDPSCSPAKSRTTVTWRTAPLPPHAHTHTHLRKRTHTDQSSQAWHMGQIQVQSQLSGVIQKVKFKGAECGTVSSAAESSVV